MAAVCQLRTMFSTGPTMRRDCCLLTSATTGTTAPRVVSAGRAMSTTSSQAAAIRSRGYQDELVNLVKRSNALITLPTGSGKTHIAACIIQHHYLPALKAAREGGTANKAIIFLAPTNPLVAQQCMMLKKLYGLRVSAYHGDGTTNISTWSSARWKQELTANDVLAMTPEVLLHILAHGAITMSNVALLIFDEAHHCKSDHPYAQIMEDFYHVLQPQQRPKVLGLTASPEGLEGAEDFGLGKKKKKNKSKGSGGAVPGGGSWGLQHRLNSRLVTAADNHRSILEACVPVPRNVEVTYNDTAAAWTEGGAVKEACKQLEAALKDLLAPAKRSELILQQLQHQAGLAAAGQMNVSAQDLSDLACFANIDGDSWGSISIVDKQVRGTKTCLEVLGPWPAAAAAHMDLLAATPPQDALGGPAAAAAAAASDGAGSTGSGGLVDLELARMMNEDDLGKPPAEMLTLLNVHCLEMASWLQDISQRSPAIVTPTEIDSAMPSSNSASLAQSRALLAPKLLRLAGKAAVMLVVSVLAGLLMQDHNAVAALLNDKGLQGAAADPGKRAAGLLHGFGATLLARVEHGTLQAQVWPNLPSSQSAPAWRGPPLLSPKVVTLLQTLASKHSNAPSSQDDWWSAIVFVETKLSALVLSKLLQSCPDMKDKLRAGYLIGDTEPGSRTGSLSMNIMKQAEVVTNFRKGQLNLLIATNIGSEGMDFKQCQLVVAFEPPTNVTSYIQARGRARKQGSEHCWLLPTSNAALAPVLARKEKLIAEAQLQDDLARRISAQTRADLSNHSSSPDLLPHLSDSALGHHPQHIKTQSGGVVTQRLAQPLLIGVCAKLPWTNSGKPPQAYYSTRQDFGTFHTTIYLPSSSGIAQPVTTAPPASNSKASKNAAALEALRQLLSLNKLDQWLQPVRKGK